MRSERFGLFVLRHDETTPWRIVPREFGSRLEPTVRGLDSGSGRHCDGGDEERGAYFPEWRGVRTKQHTYVRWISGEEELFDNLADPYQMHSLSLDAAEPDALVRLRFRASDLLSAAHDDFLPGDGYRNWYDDCRNLVRTALGPVPA